MAGIAGEVICQKFPQAIVRGVFAWRPGLCANRQPNIGLDGSRPQLSSGSLAISDGGRSVFGAGRGSCGWVKTCTNRRQKGVNTRSPRPSLLRMALGAARRSLGQRCAVAPITSSAAATSSATARCGACSTSFQNTAPAPLSRASPEITLAADPLRSTSGAPSTARPLCRDRSDCASHQRAAPPSGRPFGARSAALTSSRTYRQITGPPVSEAARSAG